MSHHMFAIYVVNKGAHELYATYSDRHRAVTALHGLRRTHPHIAYVMEGHDR